MDKFEDGCYSSLSGVALIAKVLAGRCKMNYSRAAVGSGHIPDGETPKTMTEPAGYVMDAKISSVTNPVDGECQVTVQINSSDVETGFFATGIILYADDPDEGEVPYTYLLLENGPEWIRPASSAVGKLATFDLIAAVGDIDRVTANIDPDAIATYGTVQRLIAAATAKFDITIPTEGWADCSDLFGEEAYGLWLDVPLEGVKDTMIPLLSLYPAYTDTAVACGFSTTAKTVDGGLRVYAKEKPDGEIRASLTLLCASTGVISNETTTTPGGSGSGNSYVLPAATATQLGGVKVGDGLTVALDGTLSVNPEKVMTAGDLADEGEVQQSVAEILWD